MTQRIFQNLARQGRELLSFNNWRPRLVFWTGAILVGLVTLWFVRLSDLATAQFTLWAERHAWLPFLLTPLGLMLVTWLTRRLFPGAEGSGIPQVMISLNDSDTPRFLTLRIMLGKLGLTLAALFSGASVGIMGPSVQIGAAMMLTVRRFAHFPAAYYHKGLIIAGGAAGFAAAFNTPLAGIVFAFEQLNRSFEQRVSGLVLMTVILSGLTAMILQGDIPYFSLSETAFSFEPLLFMAVILCGVVGGLLGGLFGQLIISGDRLLRPWLTTHPLLVIGALGLLIAATGHLSGYSSLGTGHKEVNALVAGTQTFDPWFPIYKFIATLASYFTGIPGGIFAPSLATGAGIGQVLAHLAPLAPVAFMVLTGMVAYFSGVIQAPVTAMVIVLEMSSSQSMIFPLMLAAITGSSLSSLICPRSLFDELADNLLAVTGYSGEEADDKKPGGLNGG